VGSSFAKRVDIVFFDAGSGHRSAARALESALSAACPSWHVGVIDLVDVIAHNRSFSRIVELGMRWFNEELQKERVFDLRGKVNLSLLFHDLLTRRGIDEIARFWARGAPDALVSVTPMYHPALYRAVRTANPRARCITIPVDFEEFKRRYWFTPAVEQHYLNGSERLWQQARARGVPEAFNHRISGMVADPALYDEPTIDVPAERARLGLAPDAPTVLAHFGGQGCTALEDVARAFVETGARYNVLFLCGRHEAVAARIRALSTPYRKAVLGYTVETPIHHQRIADVVVGKPGTLTITEALIARRPVVLLESTGMKPVQRGNEAWVRERGTGIVARGARAIPRAVGEVLANPAYRGAAERARHRGVFDAAERIVSLVSA
jgi:processive 1,2-diacylglycerol beta-glucosyltransferase